MQFRPLRMVTPERSLDSQTIRRRLKLMVTAPKRRAPSPRRPKRRKMSRKSPKRSSLPKPRLSQPQ